MTNAHWIKSFMSSGSNLKAFTAACNHTSQSSTFTYLQILINTYNYLQILTNTYNHLHTQTQIHRHRHTDTDTDTQRHRHRHRHRDTDTETQTQTKSSPPPGRGLFQRFERCGISVNPRILVLCHWCLRSFHRER